MDRAKIDLSMTSGLVPVTGRSQRALAVRLREQVAAQRAARR
jgi:hypothetical protein